MPMVERDRLLGPQPNAFIDPLRYVVILDLSISEVQPVSVGLEYIFISGYNCAARRRGIDPGGHRVRIVVSHGWIVFTKRASSRAVAVEARDIAAKLNEALAIEVRRLSDLAWHKGWSRQRARFFVLRCGCRSVHVGAGAHIDWGSRAVRVL